VHDIDVIFIEETDSIVNLLGVKGLGEIGLVGVAPAIANAVFHATGSASATCRSPWIRCCEKVVEVCRSPAASLTYRRIPLRALVLTLK
jgi:hypothetical protein